MNARLAITFITLSAMPWMAAQDTAPEPRANPLLEAFRNSRQSESRKPDEITVALDPAGEPPAPATGKAPEAGDPIPRQAETPAAPPTEEIAVEPPPPPRPGLAVRVEKMQTGSGDIDPAQVKLLAPFPAKLLAQPPAGWHIESSENAPPFTREVELSPGKKITLTIRPHLLVPEADGTDAFQVAEPGFNAPLGYRQDATVGAILATSIRQLDNDSKQLGNAIEQLQQLLVSLPQPEPAPQPAPNPQPTSTRKR